MSLKSNDKGRLDKCSKMTFNINYAKVVTN